MQKPGVKSAQIIDKEEQTMLRSNTTDDAAYTTGHSIQTDSHVVHTLANRLGGHTVVAYLRGENEESLSAQRSLLREYCRLNGYRLIEEFSDFSAKPGNGLECAMRRMKSCDGMIVADLHRLAACPSQSWRDIRPLMHHFVGPRAKHLISVSEGLNTGNACGQLSVSEIMSQQKDASERADY